ncbi:MAG: hypothetical protein EBV53_10545 [Proteobacteria bacterium]|nr:hypothetical protein [Pseudomonadota bacterium]
MPHRRTARFGETPPGFASRAILLRPESRGEVTLQSADPAQLARIRQNFLTTDQDRVVLRRGLRMGQLPGQSDRQVATPSPPSGSLPVCRRSPLRQRPWLRHRSRQHHARPSPRLLARVHPSASACQETGSWTPRKAPRVVRHDAVPSSCRPQSGHPRRSAGPEP